MRADVLKAGNNRVQDRPKGRANVPRFSDTTCRAINFAVGEFERITTRVLTPLYIGLRGPLAVLIVLPYFSLVHTP